MGVYGSCLLVCPALSALCSSCSTSPKQVESAAEPVVVSCFLLTFHLLLFASVTCNFLSDIFSVRSGKYEVWENTAYHAIGLTSVFSFSHCLVVCRGISSHAGAQRTSSLAIGCSLCGAFKCRSLAAATQQSAVVTTGSLIQCSASMPATHSPHPVSQTTPISIQVLSIGCLLIKSIEDISFFISCCFVTAFFEQFSSLPWSETNELICLNYEYEITSARDSGFFRPLVFRSLKEIQQWCFATPLDFDKWHSWTFYSCSWWWNAVPGVRGEWHTCLSQRGVKDSSAASSAGWGGRNKAAFSRERIWRIGLGHL